MRSLHQGCTEAVIHVLEMERIQSRRAGDSIAGDGLAVAAKPTPSCCSATQRQQQTHGVADFVGQPCLSWE